MGFGKGSDISIGIIAKGREQFRTGQSDNG